MNVYDFDGTIYGGDSTIDFYFYALRKKPSLIRYIPKQAAGFALHALKKIGKTELKEYFFSFLQGLDDAELVERFWDKHQHKIYSWYPVQQETEDIVISASPAFLLAPICRRLGITYLIASEVDSHTGAFAGENCHGPEKVLRLQREFGEIHIANFYSDSRSDAPLAKLADKAFLVKKGAISAWDSL